MTEVYILPSADADLGQIYDWIARDDPSVAERYILRLVAAARRLSDFPNRGAARPDIGSGIRSLVVDHYVILYEVHPERVDIVRIVHGARELGGLFGGEEE